VPRRIDLKVFQPVGFFAGTDGSLSLDVVLDLHPVPGPAAPLTLHSHS
jgi:hypothetical protein